MLKTSSNVLSDNSSSASKGKELDLKGDENERVLCNHCFRTRTNGIRCLGICVTDSDY